MLLNGNISVFSFLNAENEEKSVPRTIPVKPPPKCL